MPTNSTVITTNSTRGVTTPSKPRRPVRFCDVEGCGRKHYAKGYCRRHNAEWKRHGEVVTTTFDLLRGPADEYDCVRCGQPAWLWTCNHQDPEEQQQRAAGLPATHSRQHRYYDPLCARCHHSADNQQPEPAPFF